MYEASASPLHPGFFCELLNALTDFFKISREAIANYLGIDVEEFNSFIENSLQGIQNERDIELKIMHLYTTFVRDKRFSIG